MARTLELIFGNMEGRTVRLTLESPIEPVDPQQISQVMDQIIDKNVFDSSGGDLVEKRGACIVERSVEVIELLP